MGPVSKYRARGNALMLSASIIWGFAFAFQRSAANEINAFTFNAVRFFMGAAVLIVVIVVWDRVRHTSKERRRAASRKAILPGLITGTILAIACGLQQLALQTVSAGEAAFITGFYMVLVPLVGIFRGHKATWKIVAGVAFGMVGLYLISVKGDLTIGSGEGLLLITSLFWTAHILVIDHFAPKVSALRFSIAQFLVTAAESTLFAFIFDAHPFGGIDQAFGALFFTGFISVGIAYTLQIMGQRYALPSHAALLLATEALWGAIAGALMLAENMGLRGYTGAALMAAGIIVSQLGSIEKGPPLPKEETVNSRFKSDD